MAPVNSRVGRRSRDNVRILFQVELQIKFQDSFSGHYVYREFSHFIFSKWLISKLVFRAKKVWIIYKRKSRWGSLFCLLQYLWGPHSFLLNVYRCPFPRVKRLWPKVAHSPPSNVEVRYQWICNPTPTT
jgi:hypothetical protein